MWHKICSLKDTREIAIIICDMSPEDRNLWHEDLDYLSKILCDLKVFMLYEAYTAREEAEYDFQAARKKAAAKGDGSSVVGGAVKLLSDMNERCKPFLESAAFVDELDKDFYKVMSMARAEGSVNDVVAAGAIARPKPRPIRTEYERSAMAHFHYITGFMREYHDKPCLVPKDPRKKNKKNMLRIATKEVPEVIRIAMDLKDYFFGPEITDQLNKTIVMGCRLQSAIADEYGSPSGPSCMVCGALGGGIGICKGCCSVGFCGPRCLDYEYGWEHHVKNSPACSGSKPVFVRPAAASDARDEVVRLATQLAAMQTAAPAAARREPRSCGFCYKPEGDGERYLKCPQCKRAYYCCRKCWVADHKVHLATCTP
jgi:hypothetical protein